MPTPPMPFAAIAEAAEAYNAALADGWPPAASGPVRTAMAVAGDALGGMKNKAMRDRLTVAHALGLLGNDWPYPMPADQREARRRSYAHCDAAYRAWREGEPKPAKVAEVVRPALVSSHEPVEDWLARREAQFARKQAAAKSLDWMRFEIKRPGPFGLVFVGDPHIDDDGCDLATLRRDLDLIERTPGLYGIGLGDWINNWIGRLARLYGQQGSTESEAWRACEWLLSRPIWMLLLKGNHDLWSGGGSPMQWMVGHGTPLVDWSVRFVVASGAREWRIEAAHNFPGSSIYNKGHGPKRRAMLTGAHADLYIAGDHHVWTLQQDEAEHNNAVYWTARARGYKMLDAYADVLGHRPQQRGHSITAICDPASGLMQCFSNLPEAAGYLAFLQQRKAA